MYDFDTRYDTGRRRRLWIFAGASAALVVLFAGAWLALRPRVDASPERVAALTERLTSVDARTRLDAADALLRIAPSRPDLLLARAEAQLTLSMAVEAASTLELLRASNAGQMPDHALALLARTYLERARDQVARGSRMTIDITQVNVDDLLSEARRIQAELGGIERYKAEALRLEAESLDVRASLLHKRLGGQAEVVRLVPDDPALVPPPQAELPPGLESSSAVEQTPEIDPEPAAELPEDRLAREVAGLDSAGAEIITLRRDLQQTEQRLAEVCRQALVFDPHHPLPRELQLRAALRQGDFKALRTLAREMAAQEALSRPQAGRVAMILLDLDHLYGEYSSAQDAALARRLIHHEHLIDPADSDYHTAEVYLAYREGRLDEADTLGSRYAPLDSQPRRLARLLARIWVAKGEYDRAKRAIAHFDRAFETPEFNYEMGVTHIAAGETRSGQDHLRRALDARPGYIPARVALAQSLVDEGFILEAEPDIAAAAQVNPAHPAVMELRARLLVEKLDHEGLAALMGGGSQPPQPWQIALVAAMAIDDTLAVRRLVDRHLGEDSTQVLALVTRAWLATGASRRPDVASVLVRLWLERMRPDPFARADDPIDSSDYRRRLEAGLRNARSLSAETTGRGLTPVDLLSSRYVPRLHEQAYEMVRRSLEVRRDPMLMELIAELSVWLGRSDHWSLPVLALDVTTQGRDPVALASAAFARGEHETARKWLERLASSDRALRPTARLIELGLALGVNDQPRAYELMPDILEDHPRGEAVVLLAISDAAARLRPDQVLAWLETADRTDATTAQIARARWHLAGGRYHEALVHVQLVDRRSGNGSVVDRARAEIMASAYVALNQANRAVGVLDSVGLTARRQRFELKLAAVDTLIDGGQGNAAASLLVEGLQDASIPSWQQDELLARAVLVMAPPRAMNLIDGLLRFAPQSAVLQLYRTRVLTAQGQHDEARIGLTRLLARMPDSPRLAIERVNLDLAQGRTEEARSALERLQSQGGQIGAAASVILKTYGLAAATAPQDPPVATQDQEVVR